MANANEEVVRLMNADPAFGFLSFAKVSKESIDKLVPKGTLGDVDKMILPALRGVMLASDTKRAMSTFKNKDATTFEKVVDAGHVATDVIGMVGEVGKFGVYAPLTNIAPALATVGYVGDVVAVGLHAMGYLSERGQVNAESQKGFEGINKIFGTNAANAKSQIAEIKAERAAAQPAFQH